MSKQTVNVVITGRTTAMWYNEYMGTGKNIEVLPAASSSIFYQLPESNRIIFKTDAKVV